MSFQVNKSFNSMVVEWAIPENLPRHSSVMVSTVRFATAFGIVFQSYRAATKCFT